MISALLGLLSPFGSDMIKLCIRVIVWQCWNYSYGEKVFF